MMVIAVIYLLQVFSPMRLVDDGVVYLSIATSAVDGHGFVYHGSPERYPLGYPALIYLLVKLGLGYSWAFNALNCVFVGLGMVAAYHVLRWSLDLPPEKALLVCCMAALSFIMVKHVTQMLSDTAFFGASMGSLWVLAWAERTRNTWRKCYRTAFALGLAAFSISVRMIGVALLPAIVFAALGGAPRLRSWYQKLRLRRGPATVTITGALLLFAISAVALARTQYFHMATTNYRARGLSRSVTKAVEFQVGEWGEFAANVPQAKVPTPLQPVMFGVGMMAMAMAAAGMWRRRQNLGGLEVYMVGYLVILLAAPWQDARYLLPVVPLLLGYFMVFAEKLLKHRFINVVLVTYLVYFSLLGVAALAYTTRITFSGKSFPDVYGDGTIRATYRAAYHESTGTEAGEVNLEALDLLLRYEPRLRR